MFDPKKVIHEQTWCFQDKENTINQQLALAVKNRKDISWRLIDSVFMHEPGAWTNDIVVTDNIPLTPIKGKLLSVVPEFWHINKYTPVYTNKQPAFAYNCFMNRISGDRSQLFYELVRRNLLSHGLVSFNCLRNGTLSTDSIELRKENYDWQYQEANLERYNQEHQASCNVIPYNNIENYKGLESCIIDSNISVVLETYISDSHITFSEKLFRVLQMPRPWLLYCSPQSIKYLKQYGFDVLDDYVDHSYDQNVDHRKRLISIVDQLESFVGRVYSNVDYARFDQAAMHNRNLLCEFEKAWPKKFENILKQL